MEIRTILNDLNFGGTMQEFVNSIYEDKTLFYNTSVSERPIWIYLTPGYPPGILT